MEQKWFNDVYKNIYINGIVNRVSEERKYDRDTSFVLKVYIEKRISLEEKKNGKFKETSNFEEFVNKIVLNNRLQKVIFSRSSYKFGGRVYKYYAGSFDKDGILTIYNIKPEMLSVLKEYLSSGYVDEAKLKEMQKYASTIIHEMRHGDQGVVRYSELKGIAYDCARLLSEADANDMEKEIGYSELNKTHKMYVSIAKEIKYIIGEEDYLPRLKDFDMQLLFSKIKETTNFEFDVEDAMYMIGILYRFTDSSEERPEDMRALEEAEILLKNIFIGKRCNELGIEYDEKYYEKLSESQLYTENKIWKEFSEINTERFDFEIGSYPREREKTEKIYACKVRGYWLSICK